MLHTQKRLKSSTIKVCLESAGRDQETLWVRRPLTSSALIAFVDLAGLALPLLSLSSPDRKFIKSSKKPVSMNVSKLYVSTIRYVTRFSKTKPEDPSTAETSALPPGSSHEEPHRHSQCFGFESEAPNISCMQNLFSCPMLPLKNWSRDIVSYQMDLFFQSWRTGRLIPGCPTCRNSPIFIYSSDFLSFGLIHYQISILSVLLCPLCCIMSNIQWIRPIDPQCQHLLEDSIPSPRNLISHVSWYRRGKDNSQSNIPETKDRFNTAITHM